MNTSGMTIIQSFSYQKLFLTQLLCTNLVKQDETN